VGLIVSPEGNSDGEEEDFPRVDGGRGGDEGASRREADAAELPGGSGAASGSGFQVYTRDAEENAVFASGVCAEAADQRANSGEMGAGAGQAKSAGGSTGAAGAEVSRYAGTAGEVGGGVMQSGIQGTGKNRGIGMRG